MNRMAKKFLWDLLLLSVLAALGIIIYILAGLVIYGEVPRWLRNS